jgi:hypothetical protein
VQAALFQQFYVALTVQPDREKCKVVNEVTVEDSNLLAHDAKSFGQQFSTFQTTVVTSPSE